MSENQADLQKNLKALVDGQELMEAAMKPIAEMMKVKYEALLKVGFTKEDALAILCARGVAP